MFRGKKKEGGVQITHSCFFAIKMYVFPPLTLFFFFWLSTTFPRSPPLFFCLRPPFCVTFFASLCCITFCAFLFAWIWLSVYCTFYGSRAAARLKKYTRPIRRFPLLVLEMSH